MKSVFAAFVFISVFTSFLPAQTLLNKNDSYKPVKAIVDSLYEFTYAYDEYGRLITETREENQGNKLSFTKITSKWSASGKLESRFCETSYDGISTISEKVLYTYDNSGNLLTEIYSYLYNGNWIDQCKTIYIYDSKGRLTDKTKKEYSLVSNSWKDISRVTNEFDDIRNMTTRITYSSGSGIIRPSERATSNLNSRGKVFMTLGDRWMSNQWVPFYKDSLIYDSTNNSVSRYIYLWETSKWELCTFDKDVFNSSGKQISNLHEAYRMDTCNTRSKLEWIYDSNGNLTVFNDMQWDWKYGWKYDRKITYTYSGKSLLSMIYETGDQQGIMRNAMKLAYTYDSQNNPVTGEAFSWGIDNWVPWRYELSMVSSTNDTLRILGECVEVVYEKITSSDSKIIAAPASWSLEQNYPNPFNPETTIKYSTGREGNVKLTIYDVLGCQVSTLVDEFKPAGTYDVKFRAGDLSSGIYIYRLETGDYSAAKKLIIMK